MTDVMITKLVVGLIAGLWPLTVGFRTGQMALGVLGFFLTLGGGLITGFLLAAPVAVGCGWYMEHRRAKSVEADVGSASDPAVVAATMSGCRRVPMPVFMASHSSSFG